MRLQKVLDDLRRPAGVTVSRSDDTFQVGYVYRGRAWCFDDDTDTDLMMPMFSFLGPRADQRKHVFEANRPGWAEQVKPGDVIVGGEGFGMGSGRPAARALVDLGIGAVVAESVNGLFLRSAVNFGLPCMEAPGVASMCEEGDTVEIDFSTGTVRDLTRDKALHGRRYPAFLLRIMLKGGLIPQLRDAGYIE